MAELRVNGNIRAREVRVVAPDGSQIGVKKLEEALWLADQLDLDLVEVAPAAKPPVCKIMDYGKFKYEQSVRDREARKNQTRTVVKEIRMKPRIGDHDFQMLVRRTLQFLSEGDKVKVTIRFRGRENERPELGYNLVNRLLDELGEYATLEQSPHKEARTMNAVIAPTAAARELSKKKKEVAAEAKSSAADPTGTDAGTDADAESDPADAGASEQGAADGAQTPDGPVAASSETAGQTETDTPAASADQITENETSTEGTTDAEDEDT